MKYAVKVPIPDDDWIFVTKEGPDGLEIVLYDSREEALEQAKIWGGQGVVVEYKELIVRDCKAALDEMVRYSEELGLYDNEHGYCPQCGKDFDGTLIWDSFFDKYGDVDKADEAASSYGATREKGKWGLKVGIYSMEEDCTTHWKCPDCEHIWKR